ncbi:MAG: hypothetical protein WAW17_17155, partial [Rhodococcus sp. (in: high G+C Gram-positive bacteria)]
MTSTASTKKNAGTRSAPKAEARSRGRTREVFGKAWSNPTGKIGFVILGILVIAAVFAPLLASQDPTVQTLSATNTKPFWLGGEDGYLFGTDALGRDVYSRVLYGLR